MAKMKVQRCKRCSDIYLEEQDVRERRRILDAAPICELCNTEFEKVKEVRGLGPLYYIGTTEPVMF